MRKQHLLSAVAAAALFGLVLPISAANAEVLNENITFSVTDFNSAFGGTVPVGTVDGSFNITYDTTQTYTNSTSGISLTGLNIALGSAISFDYDPSTGLLQVGGIQPGAGETDGPATIQILPATNDFYLQLNNGNTGGPTFYQFGYGQSAEPNDFFYVSPGATTASITVGPPITAAVPEPSTWAMMVLGFFGVSFMAYRRKNNGSALTVT